MNFALLGNVVLEHGIVEDGAVVVRNGKIEYAGKREDAVLPGTVIECGDKLIGPGFVDIHNHLLDMEPDKIEKIRKAADFHLQNGTTALLFTLYRDIPHAKLLEIFQKVKLEMPTWPQLLGIHMEGPYLNPEYGAVGTGMTSHIPDPEEYRQLIASGLVRQWTFAPENENTDIFLEDILKAGIVPAIGHSEADAERVFEVCEKGVKIVTHMFDALGNGGVANNVHKTDTASAVMLMDNLYYEIICDGEQAHVPYPMIRLLLKTVGEGRLVAITDSICLPEGNRDAVYVGGELSGSCMTMRRAAQNLQKVGLGIVDVFRAVASNPARAIGAENEVGSIRAGKRANLIVTDSGFSEITVYLDGICLLNKE